MENEKTSQPNIPQETASQPMSSVTNNSYIEQSSQSSAIHSEEPIIMSSVGYCRPLLGNIKGRAYGREDTLSLFNNKIVYTSSKNTTPNIEIMLANVIKVKQRMQELWIYTNDGKNYTFEFGSPTSVISGSAIGSALGVAIMAEGVASSGISDWFMSLKNLGVSMDDSAFNTNTGMMIMVARVFIWTILIIVSLMLAIAIIAAVQGRDGGKPIVLVIEISILLACITGLKMIPSGKSVHR